MAAMKQNDERGIPLCNEGATLLGCLVGAAVPRVNLTGQFQLPGQTLNRGASSTKRTRAKWVSEATQI